MQDPGLLSSRKDLEYPYFCSAKNSPAMRELPADTSQYYWILHRYHLTPAKDVLGAVKKSQEHILYFWGLTCLDCSNLYSD